MRKQRNRSDRIIRFLSRPYRYAAVFSILLTIAFALTLLDAFVIPRAMQPVPQAAKPDSTQTKENVSELQTGPVITEASYRDANIQITIETIRAYDTDIYIADVKVSHAAYLKTAFANNTYGRNINEKTSVVAEEQNAILAINGDYYGFRDTGWVLSNGALYRTGGGSATALLMDTQGQLSCESDVAAIKERLAELWQIWSFGPPLVADGAIAVSKNQKISGRSSNSNPRTAIGQAGDLRYIFIVSDGRTNASAGLSLYELATLLRERGCSIAYNFDGGGSSTMVFRGEIVNKPTTGGAESVNGRSAILFTSAIDRMWRNLRFTFKTAAVHLTASILCIAIANIYALFGHGVRSGSMDLMFLYPLQGGTIIFVAVDFVHLRLPKRFQFISRAGYNLYNSGIATLASASMLTGIMEIAGTGSPWIQAIALAGMALIVAAVVCQTAAFFKREGVAGHAVSKSP